VVAVIFVELAEELALVRAVVVKVKEVAMAEVVVELADIDVAVIVSMLAVIFP
jgi:hypothetical protein